MGGEEKNELSEGFCFGAPGEVCYHQIEGNVIAYEDSGFTVGPVEIQGLHGDIIHSLEIQVCSLSKRPGLEIQM